MHYEVERFPARNVGEIGDYLNSMVVEGYILTDRYFLPAGNEVVLIMLKMDGEVRGEEPTEGEHQTD